MSAEIKFSLGHFALDYFFLSQRYSSEFSLRVCYGFLDVCRTLTRSFFHRFSHVFEFECQNGFNRFRGGKWGTSITRHVVHFHDGVRVARNAIQVPAMFANRKEGKKFCFCFCFVGIPDDDV